MKMNNLVSGLLLLAGTLLSLSSMPLAAQAAATIYKTKCSACHGPDGKGDTPAGNKLSVGDFASPEVRKQSDDELAATISDGKNKMPAYKKSLKPEQVKDLVAPIRTFGKK
jgi:cytochrome c6